MYELAKVQYQHDQLANKMDELAGIYDKINMREGGLVDKLVEHQQALRRSSVVSEKGLLASVLDEVQMFLSEHQMAMRETLENLAVSNQSIARFGDGELRAIFNPWFRFAFQSNSAAMSTGLREVLTYPPSNVLVALPLAGRDDFWAGLYPQVWAQLKPLLSLSYRYANAQISRPIAFDHLGEDAVELWREIWRGQKVAIITGRASRFEVIPELFDSAASVVRIDSLDTDAFSDLDRLTDPRVLGDADMYVISLGPAGTVLARQLDSRGYRALDVGHLSASYLQVFNGGRPPERLPVTSKK